MADSTCMIDQSGREMSPERRSCPREGVASLVYLELQPNNGGILLNLNAQGMRVSVAHPLTLGRHVGFSFDLGSPARIEGTGRIAWIAESGKSAGICFVDLAGDSRGQINLWLESVSSTAVGDESQIHLPEESDASLEIGVGQPETNLPNEDCTISSSFESLPEESAGADDHTDGPAESNCGLTAPGHEELVGRESDAQDSTVAESEAEEANDRSEPSLTFCAEAIEQSLFMATGQLEDARKAQKEDLTPSLHEEAETESSALDNQFSSGFYWQPGIETQQPIPPAAPQAPSETAGLNDRLPVYTLPASSRSPSSTPTLASHVIFDEFRLFGWGLERDWHVQLGLLLMVGGFLALWQQPPLLMFGIALWVAAALILTNRKQPPRDWKEARNVQ